MSQARNTARKSPSKPRIPSKAEAEILSALAQDMRISSDRIDEILRSHGVHGDAEALQRAYRLALGRRLLASMRDAEGRREVLAARSGRGGAEYVVVDGCNDPAKLKALKHRLHSHIAGLENSSGKVKNRLRFLTHIKSFTLKRNKKGGV